MTKPSVFFPVHTHTMAENMGLSISFDMRLWAIKFDTNAGHTAGPMSDLHRDKGGESGDGQSVAHLQSLLNCVFPQNMAGWGSGGKQHQQQQQLEDQDQQDGAGRARALAF